MIARIKGKLVKKSSDQIFIEVNGLSYEIQVSKGVSANLDSSLNENVEIIIFHYLQLDKSKAMPVLIGFLDELERDFFESFIRVSGIGPKAALKAFDKPVSLIARAIEDGDTNYLKGLAGIGSQKAKQIVAYLQGKVGRFALMKDQEHQMPAQDKEIIEEAKQILKRLQYSSKEIDTMVGKALDANKEVDNVENLLNEIYKQRA